MMAMSEEASEFEWRGDNYFLEFILKAKCFCC